jgi:hydrogenase expression/formation protein HypE
MSSRKLPVGKISKDVLTKYVFTCLGIPSDRVLKGPLIGEDAAIIDLGDRVLIAKANPITGAVEKIGWLSVHVNANDIAARGASPLWYLSIVLLPEGADEALLETIMKDQHKACCELGVCVVGGHTEVAPDLNRPIVSGFMLGEADKDHFITTGGAQVGDHIILTKGVGIEGTGILAADLGHLLVSDVSEDLLSRAIDLLDLVSVVPEARIATKIGAHSMHTPTEGGVLNGLLEIAEASGKGFRIYEDRLLVREETAKICAVLNIDPLRLLSSGSLLIVTDPELSSELIRLLKLSDIHATVIGEITSDSYLVVHRNGYVETVLDVVQDELFRILEGLP